MNDIPDIINYATEYVEAAKKDGTDLSGNYEAIAFKCVLEHLLQERGFEISTQEECGCDSYDEDISAKLDSIELLCKKILGHLERLEVDGVGRL